MDFEIEMNCQNIEIETTELLKFIAESRIHGLKTTKKELPIKKGELGAEELQIIAAVLSAPIVTTVVKELIDIFKSYLHSKRDTTIIIKNGAKTIEISYKNVNDTDLIDKFAKIIETAKTDKKSSSD